MHRTAAYMFTDSEVTEIEAGDAVPFNNNGFVTGGIKHNEGSEKIHIFERGLYRVTYVVNTVEDSTFALTVNDRLVQSSLVTTAGGQKIIGQAIIQLERNDYLKVRNCGDVVVTLDTFAGGVERNVRASIIVTLVDN
jgi:hypothetical protein